MSNTWSSHDRVELESQPGASAPLLQPCLLNGRRVGPSTPLEQSRAQCAAQLRALPQHLRSLQPATQAYLVDISEVVRALARQVDASTW